MKILPEIKLIKRTVYRDDRGYFLETFHEERYTALGLPGRFVQDNRSSSVKNVLRGLHYQLHTPQDKLFEVIEGAVFDVVVDIRRGSPTFGKYESITIVAEDFDQLYIPGGFAHGFCVMSDTAVIAYKCTAPYDPDDERGIAWNDPVLGIVWPVTEPIISEKDLHNPFLNALQDADLPVYNG